MSKANSTRERKLASEGKQNKSGEAKTQKLEIRVVHTSRAFRAIK
jgi:hypothetical protein